MTDSQSGCLLSSNAAIVTPFIYYLDLSRSVDNALVKTPEAISKYCVSASETFIRSLLA